MKGESYEKNWNFSSNNNADGRCNGSTGTKAW